MDGRPGRVDETPMELQREEDRKEMEEGIREWNDTVWEGTKWGDVEAFLEQDLYEEVSLYTVHHFSLQSSYGHWSYVRACCR